MTSFSLQVPVFWHQFPGKILQRVQTFSENTLQVLKGISIVDTPGILSGEKQRTGGNWAEARIYISCAEIYTPGVGVCISCERYPIHSWKRGAYFLCRNMHPWEGSELMMCSCEVLFHMLSERINSTDFCRE